MSAPLKIGLVGFGKIARDQHLPAIAGTDGIELVAIASRNAVADGLRSYHSLEDMLAAESELDAIALCQPPQARFEAARTALLAGKHVFLEKPPGATVSEVQALTALAAERGLTLFASWHSRYGSAVAAAKTWVAGHAVERLEIAWKEDVRIWHPGQDWIWEPGGFGVFDPGINALSILTEVITEPIRLIDAEFETPSNRHAPIAARLNMATAQGVPIFAEFDFRQTGPQTWDIVIEAQDQTLCLGHGGNRLSLDGVAQEPGVEAEYPTMYRHFVELVRTARSDVDTAPLQLVADAFLRGRVCPTAPFED
ncbi:MAG: galactose 1-dehydrogenase [Novosphingobium sp.]|nr:galactose 1-dehydrogenase [Novosphingobium sp.]